MSSTLVRGKYVVRKITGPHSADVISDGAVFQRDGEIIEILAVISLFGYLNRWNDSMGTVLEEGAIESADKYLSKNGWNRGKHT